MGTVISLQEYRKKRKKQIDDMCVIQTMVHTTKGQEVVITPCNPPDYFVRITQDGELHFV
jgi:hypothetical protein